MYLFVWLIFTQSSCGFKWGTDMEDSTQKTKETTYNHLYYCYLVVF